MTAPRRARPELYSRRMWLAMRALDSLPWPWGEEVLAGLFVARALARPARLRRSLAWARQQTLGGRSPWRLALACWAYYGRSVARQALVGLPAPADLRRHVAVEGLEHLGAVPAGAVLLGFHVGTLGVAVALRAAGHQLRWLGGPRGSGIWSTEAWRELRDPDETLAFSPGQEGSPEEHGVLLYRARQLIRGGATLYVLAEGWGREAFRVDLPGGPARIRSGWLVLRRHCAVPVLPVVSRLEGHLQVVTIHPPLPPPAPDAARDLEACRARIAAILEGYLRRFPEQCFALMRRASLAAARRDAAAGRSAPRA